METLICYVGGNARGNPGPAAIGVYVTDTAGVMLQEVSQSIGNATIHFAEYYAVMVGLQTLVGLLGINSRTTQIEIRLSNEMVKKQLNAESKISEPGLVPLFIEIHNLRVEHFPLVTITLITPEENSKVTEFILQELDGHA